jgi:tripartite-type tricarboxylate transporter receptor subunit TctC
LSPGALSFSSATTIDTQEMVKAGRLRMLAVTTDRRVSSLANVPTMIELGFSGFNPTAWFGYVVPAKTPPAIIDRLYNEIVKALSSEDVRARLATLGLTVFSRDTTRIRGLHRIGNGAVGEGHQGSQHQARQVMKDDVDLLTSEDSP